MMSGDGAWSQITESLLTDMRVHVRNLQERVAEAGDVVQQSQGVNEKILVMKEVGLFVHICLNAFYLSTKTK